MEDFTQKMETKEKEDHCLTSSHIPGRVQLIGPLECFAVEKVGEMSLQ